jgi:nucleotide-binding universal stress UspA family protein
MKVLIATDGSKFSSDAVDECSRMLGDAKNHEFKVVSAVDEIVPMAMEPFAVSAEYYRELQNTALANAGKAVDDAVKKIGGGVSTNIHIESQVLEGSPGRAIVEAAEEWKADLIVVGSHGYGFWERAFLGSVSNAVVHHAPCSVLVLRKQHTPG